MIPEGRSNPWQGKEVTDMVAETAESSHLTARVQQ